MDQTEVYGFTTLHINLAVAGINATTTHHAHFQYFAIFSNAILH